LLKQPKTWKSKEVISFLEKQGFCVVKGQGKGSHTKLKCVIDGVNRMVINNS